MPDKNNEFTDLVLLVGTNPLPNYVVSKYFIKKNENNMRRIWLIHSKGTNQYANDIDKIIQKEIQEHKLSNQVSIIKCCLSDISIAKTIDNETKDYLRPGKHEQMKQIHLNYTGGTKAMAVHVYKALMELWPDQFTASYLDARYYNIKWDKDSNTTGDLRKEISISWSDLFRLHNTEQIHQGQKEYIDTLNESSLDLIMSNIAKLANAGKIIELKTWIKDAGSLLGKPQPDPEKTIEEKLCAYNKKNNPELFDFLSSLPPDDKFIDESGNWITKNFPISGTSNNSPLLKKFLEGTWLEAYVYWILKKKTNEEKIHHSQITNNLLLKTREGSGTFKAEIDVLIANGYQLCGISCSTSIIEKTKNNEKEDLMPQSNKGPKNKGKEVLKNKGFEIILRSRQLGGDEARAVLVTLLDKKNTNDLGNDLKASTGASKDNFIILGMDDLPIEKMWSKLKKHIFI